MFEALAAVGPVKMMFETTYRAAQKAKDADSLMRIAEAHVAVADLMADVARLKTENQELERRLQINGDKVFRDRAYFVGQDGPFCTRCWDVDSKLVRVHDGGQFVDRCPACGTLSGPPGG